MQEPFRSKVCSGWLGRGKVRGLNPERTRHAIVAVKMDVGVCLEKEWASGPWLTDNRE